MANAIHSDQTPDDGVHVPYAWTFADIATREAGTATDGPAVTVDDIGKLGRQLDDESLWMLTGVGPITWQNVGGGSSGALNSMVLTHSGTDDMNALAADNVVPWDTETFKDAGFTHSTVSNNELIEVVADGTYLVFAELRLLGNPTSGDRYQGSARLRKNGTTDITGRQESGYARFNEGVDRARSGGTWVVKLLAGEYFEVLIDRDSDRTTAMDMIPFDSDLTIVNLEAGPAGPEGPTGPGGNDPNAVHVDVAAEITALAGVPAAAADALLIEDASDSDNKKQVSAQSVADLAPQGDVVGPASAVDGAPALYDTTTGKLLSSPTTIRYIGRAWATLLENKAGAAIPVNTPIVPGANTLSADIATNLNANEVIGVAAEASAADGDDVWVWFAGPITIACDAVAVAIGDYIDMSPTAGLAHSHAVPGTETFAIAMSAKGVGIGTIEAMFKKSEIF